MQPGIYEVIDKLLRLGAAVAAAVMAALLVPALVFVFVVIRRFRPCKG